MVTALATILHLDLDAFYASVEQLADPSLRGRPVVVGGLGPRGVVAAASYEARPYGVQSAMPMARARRACPHAVFLAPRFEAYGEASVRVMSILRDVTPLVEPIALDEAFLDVSGVSRSPSQAPAPATTVGTAAVAAGVSRSPSQDPLRGTGKEIAEGLRHRILAETGLVASVGVATTKLMAKLASELAKPDGLLVVEPGTELDVLHPLNVGCLWGVGPATRRRLDRLGVSTVGELAALSEAALVDALGQAHGRHLHALAWNRDLRAVDPNRELKSVGHEETFPRDVHDRDVLAREARRMAEKVGERLRRSGRAGRTVQLKLRYSDFRTITRSRTLPEPTDIAGEIATVAIALLDTVLASPSQPPGEPVGQGEHARGDTSGRGVRLLGVSAQQLEEATAVQTRLDFDTETDDRRDRDARARRRAVEVSVDEVRERFGAAAVKPARLVDRDRS